MSARQGAGPEAGAWFVEADHVSVTALARRRSRARLGDERTKSARVAIVSSLFFVLMVAALLVGGHAAIDPMLQSAVAVRQAKSTGEVVYTMPDGIFCRHMAFDNVTAEVTEGALERCAGAGSGQGDRTSRGFSWHTN